MTRVELGAERNRPFVRPTAVDLRELSGLRNTQRSSSRRRTTSQAALAVSLHNAGDATVLEAGPEYDGGIACVFGGQIEQEVNDDPDASNELRTSPEAGCVGAGCSRCGVIFDNDLDAGKDAGDGGLGGTELEYVSFVLHPATTNFYLQYAGDVTLVVTVDGSATEYVISSTSAPTLPYTAGKRYFVAVKSNTGVQTPWRVTLFENQ